MTIFYIYTIVQRSTGKQYIGSTSDVKARMARHFSDLKNNRHHNLHLQRAFNKYGQDDFEVVILEENKGDENDKFLSESEWIDYLEPEFNIGGVGGGDNLTKNPNRAAIIEKIRAGVKSTLEKMTEEERKARWSKPMELNPNWKGGTTYSYCTCGKRKSVLANTCLGCMDRTGENNPFYGKQHTQETKDKLREIALARNSDPNYKHPQAKEVMADGVKYGSLSECARALGKVPATILNRIRSKNYPGYFYIDEMPND